MKDNSGNSKVQYDEEEITHIRPDGNTEVIQWSQIEEIGILTTKDGPFSDDVFWIILGPGNRKGCDIPAGAIGMERLLERLQELPDFDNEAVIEASTCTCEGKFLCWRKRGSEDDQ